jgi:hypothetical protein
MGCSVTARYPPGDCWPAEMRADMAAGYLDYPTTDELLAAIRCGEAPPSSAVRTHAGESFPVWSRTLCDDFLSRRHDYASVVTVANDNPPPRGLSRAKAARHLGVTVRTFDDWVRRGIVPCSIVGTRRWDSRAIDAALDKTAGLNLNSPASALDEWVSRNARPT